MVAEYEPNTKFTPTERFFRKAAVNLADIGERVTNSRDTGMSLVRAF